MSEARHHWYLAHKHLSPWLEIAMRRLSGESRIRVREEIEAHFDDAIEDGLTRGLTEVEAAEAAIQSLGSPYRAGRQFRRTYLTRFDESILRPLVKPKPLMVIAYGGWAALAFLKFTSGRVPAWQTALEVGALSFGIFSLAFWVPAMFSRGDERRAVQLGTLAFFVLWAAIFVGTDPTEPFRWRYMLPLAAVVALAHLPASWKLSNRSRAPEEAP